MAIGTERISVIIPCHDNARHIGDAITSCLGQSRPPDEVIVVDDGSQDDSLAVIEGFGVRVRLLARPHRGAAAARNAGIAACTGTLLAFLDADDGWPVDSLALRIAEMARTGADLVYGGVRQCLGDIGDEALQLGAVIAGRLAGAMLVRRECFSRVGDFDERLTTAETIDWVSRAQAQHIREARCAETVLYRRIHGANLMLRTAAPARDCLTVLRGAVHRRNAAAA